jgi:hypothetical protein
MIYILLNNLAIGEMINSMKGITYFQKWAFSINEGAGPANIHMSINQLGWLFNVYVSILRWELVFYVGNKKKIDDWRNQ